MTLRLKNNLTLILASSSPQRAQLLRDADYAFQITPPPMDEPNDMGASVPPESQAEALSFFKARSVAKAGATGLILGADTIVALENEVFGKPADREDARRILARLMGTTQRVITGVTLLDTANNTRRIAHDVTLVTMRPMTERAVEKYLDTGQWRGKAGAYGIQDTGDVFVEHISGSFTNVVGMPMELLSRLIEDWVESDSADHKPTKTPTHG